MGDDNELGVYGEFFNQLQEPQEIYVVERSVDLVEDAERTGFDKVYGKSK